MIKFVKTRLEVIRMPNEENKSKDEIPFENAPNQRMFALAIISEKTGPNTETTQIKTKGKGMPLQEAIFYIEAWLEGIKEKIKKPFRENINFTPE